jgi:hypothetical protein
MLRIQVRFFSRRTPNENLEHHTKSTGALWAFKESTKNFTLLWNGRQRVMAFGKVAKDQFRIMMKHPFSYVQAFALCVSACVAKIG